MADYYSILGLQKGASKVEIKRAYRRLAMQWHPDKNPSSEAKAKFIVITEAYDALMSGKAFSFSRVSFQKPAAHAAAKTPEEKRKERVLRYYEARRNQFKKLRKKYQDPAKNYRKWFYGWVYFYFASGAAVVLTGLLLPALTNAGSIIFFPVSLGFAARIFYYANKKKSIADMLFGEEENYSFRELNDFIVAFEGEHGDI